RTQTNADSAAGPVDAEIDVLEGPVLVGPQVIDLEDAILQADLAETLAVKTERQNPVEPGNKAHKPLGPGRLAFGANGTLWTGGPRLHEGWGHRERSPFR